MRAIFKILSWSIVFLVMCGCTKTDSKDINKKQAVAFTEETVKVNYPLKLELGADSSNIDIYSWKNNEVKFDITKGVRGSMTEEELNEELSKINVSVHNQEDKVVLKSYYNGRAKNSVEAFTELKVYIPKRIYSLNLSLNNGKVKFLDDISCMINAEVDNANIEINKFKGLIRCILNIGEIRINSGKLMRGSTIKTKKGNIIVKSEVDSEGEYDFETGEGNIDLVLNKNAKIDLQSIGNLKTNELISQPSGAKLRVRSDMGSISIKNTEK